MDTYSNPYSNPIQYISFHFSGQISYIKYYKTYVEIPDLPSTKYITDTYNEKGVIEMSEADRRVFTRVSMCSFAFIAGINLYTSWS